MPPSAPRTIALCVDARTRRDPSTWGLNTDAGALPANSNVVANRDKAGRLVGAWREDVWGRLWARGKDDSFTQPDLDAVRRLQRDLAIRGRVAGGCEPGERVDAGSRPGDGMDAAVAAGRRVEAVLAKLSPAVRRLLEALCDPLAPPGPWRDVVMRLCGVVNERAQVREAKRAARALANAYGYEQPTPRATTLGQMNARRG